MNKKKIKDRKILLVIVSVLVIGGAIVLITRQSSLTTTKAPYSLTQEPQITSQTRTLPSYKIENIPYTYGWTSCCYCTGMTAMMAFRGMDKKTVENYWQDIKATNYQADPVIFIRLLKDYNLADKFHVAWLNPKSEKPKFEMLWKKFLTDYQKQVHYLKSEDEAFSTLKKLVSQNIPVMVGYEEDTKGTYNLVYGYDEKNIYYWTLPGNKTSDSIEKFLKMWRLPGEEFPYPNFPGHYLMMWLEK